MKNLLFLVVCIAALAGDAAAHRSNAANVKLQIYTNWPSPRTFLGCLNCAATDPTSIWNPTSRYGWSNPDGVWAQPALRHANYRRLVCDMPLTACRSIGSTDTSTTSKTNFSKLCCTRGILPSRPPSTVIDITQPTAPKTSKEIKLR